MGGFEDCNKLQGELGVSDNRGVQCRVSQMCFIRRTRGDLVKHWVSGSPAGSLQSRHIGEEPGESSWSSFSGDSYDQTSLRTRISGRGKPPRVDKGL